MLKHTVRSNAHAFFYNRRLFVCTAVRFCFAIRLERLLGDVTCCDREFKLAGKKAAFCRLEAVDFRVFTRRRKVAEAKRE